MGMFDSLFTNSDSVNAATAANAGVAQGWDQAKKFTNKGVNEYNKYATEAGAKLDPYAATGASANTMYGNALGLNGAEGNAAATGAFTTSPGFNFQLDTGLQALDRGAASKGMLGSGNTLMAEQKYGNDLANQEFQTWLKNLFAGSSAGQAAATTQAGILTGQGKTGYDANAALGKLGYDASVAQGNNTAAAELANTTAANNAFGAITSGLNLAGSLIGMGGGGSLFSGMGTGGTGATHTPGSYSSAFPMPLRA